MNAQDININNAFININNGFININNGFININDAFEIGYGGRPREWRKERGEDCKFAKDMK